jgi:SEC-C motif domain protein
LHVGARLAESPEELMRSRYSAYARGELDHVFRTWHPRTRPAAVSARPEVTWTGLQVHRVEGDLVEFTARYRTADEPGVHHEVSRFEQRGGRWVYVEAVG